MTGGAGRHGRMRPPRVPAGRGARLVARGTRRRPVAAILEALLAGLAWMG